MFINNGFNTTSAPIIVSVELTDLTKTNIGDAGDLRDTKITYSWTLNYGSSGGFCNVTSFASDPSNGNNAMWRTHSWNGDSFDLLEYKYNLETNVSPSDNSIVTELFSMLATGGFFIDDDLKNKKQYADIDDALDLIFFKYIGLPATWWFDTVTIPGGGVFTFLDNHSALPEAIKIRFKRKSRDKIGFEIGQEYFSCGNSLGTVTMQKKLEKLTSTDANGNDFIPKTKKDHNF